MLKAYVPDDFEVSAVPYFDDSCGMKFQPHDFESTLDFFWQSRSRFDPRSFIINHLSPGQMARAYLEKYEECASDG
jgi:hypothetical protein